MEKEPSCAIKDEPLSRMSLKSFYAVAEHAARTRDVSLMTQCFEFLYQKHEHLSCVVEELSRAVANLKRGSINHG